MNTNKPIHLMRINELQNGKKIQSAMITYFIRLFIPVMFFLLLFDYSSFCQNINAYSEKYRYYRERFNQYFVFVGPNPGESLPSPSRALKNGNPTFKTEDLPNQLGWYIGMLATEYKLTNDEGGDVDRIVEELYYALFALNRLNVCNQSNIGNTDRDGFMVRDDFPADFFTGSNNVHLAALNKGLPNPEDHELIQVATHNGASLEPYGYGPNGAAMSKDHYCRILMGLALVKKFVPSGVYSATPFQDGTISIQQEAKNIADRIITYMKNGVNGL